ncbi:MAG: serine/threonine protein kinase [Cotesia congregata filamentous virus 2]
MLRIKNPPEFIVDHIYTTCASKKVVRGSVNCIIQPLKMYSDDDNNNNSDDDDNNENGNNSDCYCYKTLGRKNCFPVDMTNKKNFFKSLLPSVASSSLPSLSAITAPNNISTIASADATANNNNTSNIQRITVVRKIKCENEFKYLKSLNHNNIISIFDASEKYLYFKVYDYTLFEFFNKFMTKNKITNHNTIRYISNELLKALNYLRSKNIVHRDLKMINVLVNYKSKILNSLLINTLKIVLIDFEFAILSNSKELLRNKPRCMTWISAAPEVALKRLKSYERTFTIDYWALGTIVFQMFFLRQCLLNKYKTRIKEMNIDKVNNKESQETIIKSMYCTDIKQNERDMINYISMKGKKTNDVDLQCCLFIKSLLEVNPKKRLGYNSIHEILTHSYMTMPIVL